MLNHSTAENRSDGRDVEAGIVSPLKDRLAAGQITVCMSVRLSRTIEIAAIAVACGFDALYVDPAHASMTVETAGQICLAANLAGITALVRVPHEPSYMSRVLDAGALGVIVPQVDTPEQALRVVQECRFAPRGRRSIPGAGAILGYRRMSSGTASRLLDDATLVVAMIESPEAVANAEAIAAVDGIDMLLVGSQDLTLTLEAEGSGAAARLWDAYEAVGTACRVHGKTFGIAGVRNDPARISRLLSLGARFFTAGNDEAFILAEGRRQVEGSRTLTASGGQGPEA
jgi:2-keto-3-deoxy-L-rhamnonate aldolase RhmA